MIITTQMVLIIRKSLQIKRKITMTMIWVMKMIISCCCVSDVIYGISKKKLIDLKLLLSSLLKFRQYNVILIV